MARITFTEKQKAEAIKLWVIDKRKPDDVAEHIGCSIASLNVWKKAYREGNLDLSILDEEEEEEQSPPSCRSLVSSPTKSEPKETLDEFTKRYWRNRSVETVMTMPETIDEVVALVNKALRYAYQDLTS